MPLLYPSFSIFLDQLHDFSSDLKIWDDTVRSILSSIMNIFISPSAWTQASLPVKNGSFGISPVSAIDGLIHCILPSRFGPTRPLFVALHFLVGLRVMIFHPRLLLHPLVRKLGTSVG